MTTNNATMTGAQPRAGAFETSALVGFRLFQALGWRIGAGVTALTALPMSAASWLMLSYVDACYEITKAGRAGSYTICTSFYKEHIFGWALLGFALLCLVAAVGLWKRGGAVRDVEILAEQVEGGAQ